MSKGNSEELLFLVNAEWIKMWASFVSQNGTLPGPIINDMLYLKTEQDTELYIGKDVIFVSADLWNILYEEFGGGPTLKWKIEMNEKC